MIWGKLGHVTGSVWTPLDRGRAGPPRTTMSKRGHGDWEREIEKTQPEQTFRHKEAFGLNVSAEIGFSPTTSRVKVNNFQNGPFPIWLIVINHQKTRYTHKLTGTKYSFASPDLCLKGHTHLSVFLPPPDVAVVLRLPHLVAFSDVFHVGCVRNSSRLRLRDVWRRLCYFREPVLCNQPRLPDSLPVLFMGR